MLIIEILLAALAATSVMTLFSYAVSESFRKLYKEPVLLDFVLTSYHIEWTPKQKRVAGWIIHYLIGLVFVSLYYVASVILEWFDINIKTGLIFGAVCGVLGIFGWAVMFHFNDREEPVKLSGYFLQLFFAHLFFGVTTAATHLATTAFDSP